MADKPEIFLEIGAGYFRIPTAEVNYNITIIGDRTVSSAGTAFSLPDEPHIPPFSAGESGSDYYQKVSEDLYHDIGQLAKSLSSTIMEIPAEDRRQERATLDEAGEKLENAKTQLKDIVAMTEKATMEIMDNVEKVQGGTGDVQELLSELKNHPAFTANGVEENDEKGEEEGAQLSTEIAALNEDISAALNLIDEIRTADPQAAGPGHAALLEKKQRYLFDLDVIFQTLYELCTNETVKDHISGAREKAGEFFDTIGFQDKISIKASGYEADGDNYFNVPMSDVFQSLFAACNDKGIKNLLKKMDTGQSTIFLDQFIPLEVPEVEVVEDVGADDVAGPDTPPGFDPRLDEVVQALHKCQEGLTQLPEAAGKAGTATPAGSVMSSEDLRDIFTKIESAFGVSTAITADVSKIAEVLSFQDLSGQQIMKILKLLSDFQIQLLAIVVSFGSQLKQKRENVNISIDESKSLAQSDVDRYLGAIPGEGRSDDDGVLDQETVNQMLEEFGF